jgi:hypothetical protein
MASRPSTVGHPSFPDGTSVNARASRSRFWTPCCPHLPEIGSIMEAHSGGPKLRGLHSHCVACPHVGQNLTMNSAGMGMWLELSAVCKLQGTIMTAVCFVLCMQASPATRALSVEGALCCYATDTIYAGNYWIGGSGGHISTSRQIQQSSGLCDIDQQRVGRFCVSWQGGCSA